MIFTEISSRMLWRRRLRESWWRRPWPRCLEERWGGPAGGRSGGQSPRHSRPRCRCWRSPPWCSVEWLLLYNMDWTTWQGRGWRRRLHLIDGQCWLLDQSRRERSHHNIEAFTLTKSQGILVSARMTVQSNSRLPAQVIGLDWKWVGAVQKLPESGLFLDLTEVLKYLQLIVFVIIVIVICCCFGLIVITFLTFENRDLAGY